MPLHHKLLSVRYMLFSLQRLGPYIDHISPVNKTPGSTTYELHFTHLKDLGVPPDPEYPDAISLQNNPLFLRLNIIHSAGELSTYRNGTVTRFFRGHLGDLGGKIGFDFGFSSKDLQHQRGPESPEEQYLINTLEQRLLELLQDSSPSFLKKT